MLDDDDVMAPKRPEGRRQDSVPERILWSVLTAVLAGVILTGVQHYSDSRAGLISRVNALEIRDAAKAEQISEGRRVFDSIDGRLQRIEEHLLRSHK